MNTALQWPQRTLPARALSCSGVTRKAVLQDVASFEETQETLALLKILALGQQDVEAGRVKPVADVVARLRAKRAAA